MYGNSFSLNRKSFPIKCGLVDQQHKLTSMLQQLFSQITISTVNMKVMSLEGFAIYSKYNNSYITKM